ncbi:MAG: D-alanine--D-alanine ligase [Chloroflexi bacterium]|nr:D-alanine--D-alanine ligase [Chloroflexota bacterium]
MRKKRLRVGVIFGGRSSEHDVSLASARSVMSVLDPERYDVVPVGITRDGRWLVSGDPMKQLKTGQVEGGKSPLFLASPGRVAETGLVPEPTSPVSDVFGSIDVMFPVLHGPNGEDGTIQGLLELASIPYIGAGVLASAVGMDKVLMKAVFQQHNLPVPNHLVFRASDIDRNDHVECVVEESIGFPCFVKPANMGSSVGISKAHNRAELWPALREAMRFDRKVLVEEFVDGGEYECSVLGNDDPVASVVGEIIPCNEFYDYRAKYIDAGTKLVIPADLPNEISENIRELSVKAFLAIDCSGMARVDFLVRRATGDVLISEINTIPGFTSISMYPKLWEASGLSYTDLIDRLIELALERHAEKERCWRESQSQTSSDGGVL